MPLIIPTEPPSVDDNGFVTRQRAKIVMAELRRRGVTFKQLNAEESRAIEDEFLGYDFPEMTERGDYLRINPVQRARYTPRPYRFNLRPIHDHWLYLKNYFTSPSAPEEVSETIQLTKWNDLIKAYSEIRAEKPIWWIFGAGASTLDLDLEYLDNQIVWGINWTMEWFVPTFCQVIDEQVWNWIASYRGEHRDVCQMVSSTWMMGQFLRSEEKIVAQYKGHHPGIPSQSLEFHFADSPAQTLAHYANSLGVALNMATWFKPEKIVLVGFDWGGPHFFGDGRTRGSLCHYGQGGIMKPMLIPQLEMLRKCMDDRGVKVLQVGPTKCPVWQDRVVGSLKEAIQHG